MTKRLQALRDKIQADPTRRERVKKYERAIETALALGRLREARAVTQSELAARMAVSQANISRIERGDDLYLSTLRYYIENLGGRLEINAVFPDATMTIEATGVRVHATVLAPITPPNLLPAAQLSGPCFDSGFEAASLGATLTAGYQRPDLQFTAFSREGGESLARVQANAAIQDVLASSNDNRGPGDTPTSQMVA